MKKLLYLLLPFTLVACGDYSDGERTGVVIKFSYKGLICKTWEAEMNLGGLRNKSTTDSNGNSRTTMVANVWQFTVEDLTLIPKVQQALASGEPVTVRYRQEVIASPCRSSSDGDYFAVAVQ